jgi:hypothetical protein
MGGLRKSDIDGVNLIKAHYMHVCKYHNDIPLYNYTNKKLKEKLKRKSKIRYCLNQETRLGPLDA